MGATCKQPPFQPPPTGVTSDADLAGCHGAVRSGVSRGVRERCAPKASTAGKRRGAKRLQLAVLDAAGETAAPSPDAFPVSSLADAESSLGDAKSSLGDAGHAGGPSRRPSPGYIVFTLAPGNSIKGLY